MSIYNNQVCLTEVFENYLSYMQQCPNVDYSAVNASTRQANRLTITSCKFILKAPPADIWYICLAMALALSLERDSALT